MWDFTKLPVARTARVGKATLIACVVLASAELHAQDQQLADALAAYEKAAGPAARMAALHAIAKCGSAPVEELTRALARGLQDPCGEVRAEAVPLVAEAPTSELAITALLGACHDLQSRFDAAVRKNKVNLPGGQPRQKDIDVHDAKRLGEWLDRQKKLAADLDELSKAFEDACATLEPLVHVFMRMTDERAVEGLKILLEHTVLTEHGNQIAVRMLEFGTKPALVAVAGSVRMLEMARKDCANAEREARSLRAKPDYWRGTSEAWQTAESVRRAAAITNAEEATRAMTEKARTYTDRIRAFALAHDLATPPPNNFGAAAWHSWADSVRSLPEHDNR